MKDGSLLSADLKLAGRLDARFFALLEALDATGSINKAARSRRWPPSARTAPAS